MKKIITVLSLSVMLVITLCSCSIFDEVDVASENVSKEADNFKSYRKVTIINNMTDTTLLEFEGWASIKVDEGEKQLEIIYRTGKEQYKKDFVGLNNMTTYVVTQLDSMNVDPYQYEWTYHSEGNLIPIDIEDMDKE